MTSPAPERVLELGPYRIVRTYSSRTLRIYRVTASQTGSTLALLTRVKAPEFGIPEEWAIRCTECNSRKDWPTRDRALGWLGMHRVTKHPNEVRKQGT